MSAGLRKNDVDILPGDRLIVAYAATGKACEDEVSVITINATSNTRDLVIVAAFLVVIIMVKNKEDAILFAGKKY